MPAFQYRLILKDGTLADPPTFESSTPTWRPVDTIFLNPTNRVRVIAVAEATLTVEPVSASRQSVASERLYCQPDK